MRLRINGAQECSHQSAVKGDASFEPFSPKRYPPDRDGHAFRYRLVGAYGQLTRPALPRIVRMSSAAWDVT